MEQTVCTKIRFVPKLIL